MLDYVFKFSPLMLLFVTASLSSLGCVACEESMNVMYKSLEKGESRKVIIGLLNEICVPLKNDTQRAECQTFIDENYDGLIKWLKTTYTPKMLCQLMGACSGHVDPLQPACAACEVGFKFLENIWSYGPSEDLIEQLLNYICEMFPADSTWPAECKAFVDQEFERLISYVDKEFPPKYICTMINACDFPVNPVDGVCETCKGGFQFIYDAFNFDNDNGGDLAEKALDYICYMFPENSSARSDCMKFVNKEYSNLLQFLEVDFSPELICELVKGCESPINDDMVKNECSVCTTLVNETTNALGKAATEDEIDVFFLYVCDLFPADKQDECTNFISSYSDGLKKIVMQGVDAKKGCKSLGAC